MGARSGDTHSDGLATGSLTGPSGHKELARPAHSSPGVWQRAEGTPRKGGLRWGPRVMCGAFWGDSKGGGCDSSLWTTGR